MSQESKPIPKPKLPRCSQLIKKEIRTPSLESSLSSEKQIASISPDEEEYVSEESLSVRSNEQDKNLKIGDILPYGQRLFEGSIENVVRMKDIGANKRLILVGVLGSFTPDCWNRHLFKVLDKYEYYKERGVHYICCVATNDPYTHTAWGQAIGASEKMLMWSDMTTKFTKLIGKDVTVPFLDTLIRCKRFVLQADDMVVTKIISAADHADILWRCNHLQMLEEDEDSETDDN